VNLTDLRDILDERSAGYDVEARSHLMLTGVHQRLAIRRRRRIAATAAAVVLVLAGGIGTLAVNRPARPVPAPAATAAVVGGFPAYAQGARVIAASAPLAAGATSVRLTFTPATTDLVFFDRCPDGGAAYSIAVNGRTMMSGNGCGGSFAIDLSDPAGGLLVGRPNTVVATFKGAPVRGFAVAVGEKVPIDQYVFPARPATLAPLAVDDLNFNDPGLGGKTLALLRGDPADPNRPAWATVTWGRHLHLVSRSQTPGRLTITIGELTLSQAQWWDYEQVTVDGGREDTWTQGTLPKPGARVTITVTPERMTGDWAVSLQENS
jgi:hypothetical protein